MRSAVTGERVRRAEVLAALSLAIYTKISVNNRTGASLFATRHGIADDLHRQLPET